NAFADFLLQSTGNGARIPTDFIQSFTQDSAQHRYYQRFQIAKPNFHDDWKATNQLTLNLILNRSLFGTYLELLKNSWNWESARFDKSRFAVNPCSGVLLDRTVPTTETCNSVQLPGSPVFFNSGNFALDPGIVSNLGLVQCGVNGTPEG